jgi:hypothetical protein
MVKSRAPSRLSYCMIRTHMLAYKHRDWWPATLKSGQIPGSDMWIGGQD